MAFQEKIIEVQGLLDRVNTTLKEQLDMVNQLGTAIGKYSGKLPSDFINAQKEAIALSKAQQEEIKKLSLIEKEAEAVKQKQIATQIKVNQEKKSAIALTNAEAQSQAKAAAEANRSALANEKLNRAYVQLNMQRTAAKNKLQDLIASEQASNKEIRIAQKEFDVLDKRIQKANHAVGNFSSSVGNYKNALSGIGNLMGAFGISTGLYLGASIVKDIYETTKQLQSLDLALKMVSGSQQEFVANQAFISSIAEKWGLEIKSITQQYTQFYTASKGLLSQKAIQETFEGIAKAGSIMGLSLEKQADAFYAIDQMMSKGTVTAEELKKQLGNAMPGAIKAAAMAYMDLHPAIKTIQEAEKELYAAMKKGALDSATYVPLIVKNLNKIYGTDQIEKIETLQAAQNRLSNSWTDLIRHMNESDTNGLTSFFTTLMSYISGAVRGLDKLASSLNQVTKGGRSKGNTEEYGLMSADVKGLNKQQIDDAVQDYKYKITAALKEIARLNKEAKEGGTLQDILTIHLRNNEFEKWFTYLGRAEGGLKAIREYQKQINKATKTPEAKAETDEERKARLAREKKEAQATEQRLKDAYDLDVSNIKRKIEVAKDEYKIVSELRKDELGYIEGGVAKKMALSMKLATFELELAQRVAKEKKRLAQGNTKLGIDPTIGGDTIAQNEYNTEAENVAQEHVDRMDKINKDYFKAMEEAVPKDWSSKTPTMWTKEQIKQAEEDQKKIKEIQDKIKDDFEKYIEGFKKDFAGDLGFEKTFEFFVKLQDNGKTMFQNLGLLVDGSKEKFAAAFLGISEAAQEMFNFMSQASQENFDAEYDRLERQKENALRFAGGSESGRAEIERQYERKRQQIARREAKAKKELALFNIAVDTAQAVVAFLAKGQWQMAIAAGVLGAIQLAVVSSKDIPQYWKGTDNATEGVAWTQERGQEIITDKHGKVKDMGDNKGPRLTYLKQGDKVIKNRETLDILSFNRSYANLMDSTGISGQVINVEGGGINSERFDEGISRLEKVIKDKPSFQLIDDERGRRLYREYRGERTQLMNDRQNIISRDV